eukprot:gene7154-7369_t
MPVEKDASNGLEKLVLRSAQGNIAEIYLHGAHVVSWKDSTGKDIMFTSKEAVFKPPKAIRGGVPVCFPQFGQLGPLGQHGFARNTTFDLLDEDGSSATLQILQSPGTEDPKYPHPFELRVKISLGDNTFTQTLTAANTGDSEMSFTAALHTYYTVSSIDEVTVEGLEGVTYTDSLAGGREVKQQGPVVFDQEVDRIYLATPDSPIKVIDNGSGATVEIHKVGFPDAVVWNPWIDKAKAMGDFGDEEYKEMLCIEPAVAGSGAFKLAPGALWTGMQKLVYKP